VALLMFGLGYAVQDPVVARFTVPIPGLQRPVRVVQLSDVHASQFDMPVMRLRRIVAMANAMHPDLIVLSGDYISGYPPAWTPTEARLALAPLSGLKAPLGVVAVLGNHDSRAMTQYAFAGSGIKLLVGQTFDAGPMVVAGADDLLNAAFSVTGLRKAVSYVPPGKPIIALSHEPEFFMWLPKRVSLLLAGHTHGGQIVFPVLGTMRHNAFVDAHRRGLYREHRQMLVVSSGLGTSVLPLRIGVPPEITETLLLPPAYSVGRNSGTDR
jgi:predicted MPP superfamily phosphohydrolase